MGREAVSGQKRGPASLRACEGQVWRRVRGAGLGGGSTCQTERRVYRRAVGATPRTGCRWRGRWCEDWCEDARCGPGCSRTILRSLPRRYCRWLGFPKPFSVRCAQARSWQCCCLGKKDCRLSRWSQTGGGGACRGRPNCRGKSAPHGRCRRGAGARWEGRGAGGRRWWWYRQCPHGHGQRWERRYGQRWERRLEQRCERRHGQSCERRRGGWKTFVGGSRAARKNRRWNGRGARRGRRRQGPGWRKDSGWGRELPAQQGWVEGAVSHGRAERTRLSGVIEFWGQASWLTSSMKGPSTASCFIAISPPPRMVEYRGEGIEYRGEEVEYWREGGEGAHLIDE